MAMPFPEGECFFKRSVISNYLYSANDPADFYSSFMIEYIWNAPAHPGPTEQILTHPRSEFKNFYFMSTWSHISVSYGDRPAAPQRRARHNLCCNPERLVNQVSGDPAEAWFMVFPMPTNDEGWAWIDLVAHIRGIYIPVAQSTSERFPDLSTWVKLGFNHGSDIKFDKYWKHTFKTDKTFGLKADPSITVGFHMKGLLDLLCVPHFMRQTDPYAMQLVKVAHSDDQGTIPVNKELNDRDDFDWLTIEREHTGMSIAYEEPKKGSSWITNFVKNLFEFAIGMIPGIGSLLTVAFDLGWTAIYDPDSFEDELALWVPAIKVPELWKSEIKESAARMRDIIGDLSYHEAKAKFSEMFEQELHGRSIMSFQQAAAEAGLQVTDSDPPEYVKQSREKPEDGDMNDQVAPISLDSKGAACGKDPVLDS